MVFYVHEHSQLRRKLKERWLTPFLVKERWLTPFPVSAFLPVSGNFDNGSVVISGSRISVRDDMEIDSGSEAGMTTRIFRSGLSPFGRSAVGMTYCGSQ